MASPDTLAPRGQAGAYYVPPPHREPQQLADILERVLDKGIVVAGDIQVRLLDIELLTIKLRLLVCSLERARAVGMDWWERDPFLSSRADKRSLQKRVASLERRLGGPSASRRRAPSRKRAARH